MIDARTFGNNLDEARKILSEHNARFLGEYIVNDTIFASKDPSKNLGDVFMRLRLVPKIFGMNQQ